MMIAAIFRRHRTAFFYVTAVTVVVLLLGVMGATTIQVERERRSIAMVQHTFIVDELLAALLSTLKDAETGQRGYLLSGKESYLQPYIESAARIGPQIERIAAETVDNASQQARIARVRPLFRQKLDELERTIALRRLGQEDQLMRLVLSDEGKATMDAIRGIVGEMRAEEARLLQERRETRDDILACSAGVAVGFACCDVGRAAGRSPCATGRHPKVSSDELVARTRYGLRASR
jgi:methyl-accepting chemotaxis protein